MSQFESFTFESLKDLDARIAVSVNKHLRRASDDCADRPHDPKARSVTIQLDITPDTEQDGKCSKANLQVHVSSKVPAHRTAPMSLRLTTEGVLKFNPDSLENADQTSFGYSQDDDQ